IALAVRRREVPVPEESQLLDRGARRKEHAPEPPAARGAEVIEPRRDAGDEAHVRIILGGIEERLRGARWPELDRPLDECRRRPERCAAHEMARGRTVPLAIHPGTKG